MDVIERESVDSEEDKIQEENIPQRIKYTINIVDVIITSINRQYMRVYCASKSLY